MRFRVLGPIRVFDGTAWMPVAAAQQRLALAVLLVERGQLVTLERLVNEIWGARPPATAVTAIRMLVMRLRRLPGIQLVTRNSGYELVAGETDVDIGVFERLVGHGKEELAAGRPELAIDRLTEALALWHGPALADVARSPTIEARIGHWEQARLAAAEQRLDVLLDLRRPAEVAEQAARLLDEQPLRESLWAHLMIGLYRCGRRDDALGAFRKAREVLVAELGLEPGSTLQVLHERILAGDQVSRLPALTRSAVIRPAQLSPDIPGFTGRDRSLDWLDERLSGSAVVISAIAGAAGVGKTALAVHWAHRARDRFPDGQLEVNLRGYAAGEPLQALEVLGSFLRTLGVAAEQIPDQLTAAAALYRSLMAGKRMLVLLDNAGHADQVRPLFPAAPGCLVLVTSRDRLDGLVARDGAVRLDLDVLTAGETRALLGQLLDPEQVAAEPEAVARLGELCGRLPLAVRIAAAGLTARPHLSVAGYVAELIAAGALDTLEFADDPRASVRVAFGHSYQALPADAGGMFRLIGLVPGPDLTAASAAALAELPIQRADRLLRDLATANLLEEHAAGRYRAHDLVRLYATEKAGEEDGESDRRAALDRLYEHYLRNTSAAVALLYPHSIRLPGPAASRGPVYAGHQQALSWLDAERANLVAATRHAATEDQWQQAWLLADALRSYLWLAVHPTDLRIVAEAGLSAAQAAGDPFGLAASQLCWASLHNSRNRYPQAARRYADALDAARTAGWVRGESVILGNLGQVCVELGRLDEAADYYDQALAINRRHGWLDREAAILSNLGRLSVEQGEPERAVQLLSQALELHRRAGVHTGEAIALTFLGQALVELGRFTEAGASLDRALALTREVGARPGQAHVMSLLATMHREAGQIEEAETLARATLALAREIDDHHFEAAALITLVSLPTTDPRRAVDDCRRALELARGVGAYLETSALIALAEALDRAGDGRSARKHADAALAIARRIGYRLLEARARSIGQRSR